VQILESRPDHASLYRGTGIMLRPNATRILSSPAFNLSNALAPVVDTSASTAIYRLDTGQLVTGRTAINVSTFPDWGVGRDEALRVLYSAAVEVGAHLQFGAVVESINEVERTGESAVKVRLQDGKVLEADLVLDASGAHSKLRRGILRDIGRPDVDATVVDGTAYAFKVPVARLRESTITRELLDSTDLNVWMGGSERYVVGRYQTTANEYHFLFFVSDESAAETGMDRRLWDGAGDVAHVREAYRGKCCAALWECLGMVEKCERWRLSEMPDLERWASRSGRVLLCGDSAHAMLPNAAQGFSQIVEDVGVLDYLLHGESRLMSWRVGEVVKLWEKARIPRVARVKAFARWNTDAFRGVLRFHRRQNEGEQGPGERTVVDLRDVMQDENADFSSGTFLKWVMDFDAIEEARRFVDREVVNSDKAKL